MKVWQCSVCKYIHKGAAPPEKCPVCNVSASKFKEIDEASIPGKKPVRKKIEGAQQPASKPAREVSKFEKITLLLIKHHAHPISVHMPNGILPVALLLLIGAWIFGSDLLSKAAFINLIFVIVALPFVIFTGVLEWKRKYNSALTTTFKLKIVVAALTALLCSISFIWYLINPDILSSPNAWLFILINIIMVVCVGIAGHIGGKLVFKD